MTRTRTRASTGLASLAVAAMLLTGCGDQAGPGDEDSAPSAPAAQQGTATPAEATGTPATTADPSLVTEVPAGFPLDDGLPVTNGDDGSPVEVVDQPGWDDVELCGEVAWSPAAPVPSVDVAGATFTGEAEDVRSRTLAVYADAAAAAAALAALRDGVARCPDGVTGGTEQVYEEVAGDDASATFTHRYRTGGRFDTGLEVLQAVQRGNALYLAGYYGEGGGSDESIRSAIELAGQESAGVVEALTTVFASESDPTDDPTDSPSDDPTGSPSAEDLSDLPLLSGWPEEPSEAGEPGREGPGADLDPVWFEPCATPPDDAAATSRIHAAFSNVEDYRRRTLLVFETADDAVAYAGRARSAVESCPLEEEFSPHQATAWRVEPTATGGESFAAVSHDTYDGAPGIHLYVVHLTRLGRAVLLDSWGNEGGGDPEGERAVVDRVVAAQAPVVEAMCRFTAAGC